MTLNKLEQEIVEYLKNPPFPASFNELTLKFSETSEQELQMELETLCQFRIVYNMKMGRTKSYWYYNFDFKENRTIK